MKPRSISGAQTHELTQSLVQSLQNLRAYWPSAWPGLPLVMDRCLWRLGGVQRPSSRMKSLMALARAIADAVEQDGQNRMREQREPAYHNRLHIADTLVSMTHLLLAQRQSQSKSQALRVSECLALVVMLGHDFLHTGRVNSFPAELESSAVAQLQPLMLAHGVTTGDMDTIGHCILKTEPSGVKQSHILIADRVFDLDDRDCLAVLVAEADILASTLTATGVPLTDMLAKEWSAFNPALGQSLLQPGSRIYFLENAALFSSPAARVLGIQALKQAELSSLRPSSC
jgi:hypothetical protein